MALNGLPRRLQRAFRSAMSGGAASSEQVGGAALSDEPAVDPASDPEPVQARARSAESQAALERTVLSLADLQAALGPDFLTDRTLDALAAGRLEPAAALRSARNEFGRRVRVRSFGPILGKWVLYHHPEGFSVWLKLGDSVSTAILRGSYDPAVTDLVRALLKPGGTFLDIGANVGWYTLVAASFYRRQGGKGDGEGAGNVGGRVLTFEPQAELFEHLEKSVAQNGFEGIVKLHPHALGDRDGPIQMVAAGLNSGGSYVVPEGKERAEFETARIARFDGLGPVPGRVDAVKLDIEGAEPLFFRGAQAFFERNRPPIVSEVNVRKLRTVSNMSGTDYVRMVLDLGYTVSAIQPRGGLAPFDWGTADDEHLSANVMFEPR